MKYLRFFSLCILVALASPIDAQSCFISNFSIDDSGFADARGSRRCLNSIMSHPSSLRDGKWIDGREPSMAEAPYENSGSYRFASPTIHPIVEGVNSVLTVQFKIDTILGCDWFCIGIRDMNTTKFAHMNQLSGIEMKLFDAAFVPSPSCEVTSNPRICQYPSYCISGKIPENVVSFDVYSPLYTLGVRAEFMMASQRSYRRGQGFEVSSVEFCNNAGL